MLTDIPVQGFDPRKTRLCTKNLAAEQKRYHTRTLVGWLVVMNVQKWRVQRLALASELHTVFNEMRVCLKANYTWVTCTASSPLTCCTFR